MEDLALIPDCALADYVKCHGRGRKTGSKRVQTQDSLVSSGLGLQVHLSVRRAGEWAEVDTKPTSMLPL